MPKKVKDYFTNSTISNIFTLLAAVLGYLAFSNFAEVKKLFLGVYGIISPFVLAYIVAFILNTPVKWFEKTLFSNAKAKRGLSITTVYIITLVAVVALVVAIGPQIQQSALVVIGSFPKYIETITVLLNNIATEFNLNEQITQEIVTAFSEILKSVSAFLMAIVPQIVNFSVSIGTMILNFLMAVIASIYMLASKEKLIFQIKKILHAYLPIHHAQRIITIGRRSSFIFSKFINGKMLDSLIIGIICFVGMLFIYSPYAILIALIIGVTNMIPFFGPFIGAIPSIFILLMVKPIHALAFTIFVLVLQQFDGNILGPKILGDSTGLSALWVLFAIVVGAGMFGFLGMLIGVPTFAVIYSLVSENMDNRLEKKNVLLDRDSCSLTIDGEDKNDESSQ